MECRMNVILDLDNTIINALMIVIEKNFRVISVVSLNIEI